MAAAAANSSILPDVGEANPGVVVFPATPPVSPRALPDPLPPEHPQQPDMDTSIRQNPKPSSSSISIDGKSINDEYMFSLLSTTEGFKSVTTLQGTDAITVADFLDNGLNSKRLNEDLRKVYIGALRKLCGKAVILPTSHKITEGLQKKGDLARAGGGYSDVWEGTYKGQNVAIKALKVNMMDDKNKVKKRLYKEAVTWKYFSHPNLLPFFGVKISEFDFWLVSPWMTDGNLDEYVKSHPQADRVLLFRGIVNGLVYLHSNDIIHGDLKGPNILIRGANQACLADFGLTTIVSETIPGYSMSVTNIGGTERWMAPELLDDIDQPSSSPKQELTPQATQSRKTPSRQSDVYALGIIVYEVITGTIPFGQYKMAIGHKVLQGLRPQRPNDPTIVKFVDALWPIAEECWRAKKEDRPTITEVQKSLDSGSFFEAQDQNPNRIDWKTIKEEDLSSILSTADGFKSVTRLQGTDAITVADRLDNYLDSKRLDEDQRKHYIAAVRKLCGKAVILPTSHQITDGLQKKGDLARAGGGYSDVWEGTYKGQNVAIKALKVYLMGDKNKVKKRLYKEAVTWKYFSHPNLLPFFGVKISEFDFWLVSPWMTDGNLNEYVESHPQADRVLLFRGIVNGLVYLHSNDIIHGDLKGPNILIRGANQACLADFGLTTIVSETIPGYSMTATNSGGTTRWMAPELLLDDDDIDQPSSAKMELTVPSQKSAPSKMSKESDVYALGIIVYEVITGTIPFSEYTNLAVISKIIKGLRPQRPNDPTIVKFVDTLWPIAEKCWDVKKENRPTIIQVQDSLPPSTPPLDREFIDTPDLSDLRPNADQPEVQLPGPHLIKPIPVNPVDEPENVSHSPHQAHINDVDHSQEPKIGASAVPRPKAGNGQCSSSTATAVQHSNQNNIPKSVEPGGAYDATKEREEEKKYESSCGCCVIQ